MRFCAPLRASSQPALQWIEISSRFQIPAFHIVGLASREVHEARERVRAAIEASGWEFPRRKVVINLSPADVRKQGTATDLAMALSVRALQEEASPGAVIAASAELGLEGQLKPGGQVLHALLSCRMSGVGRLLVAEAELAAAQSLRRRFPMLRSVRVAGCARLTDAWEAARAPAEAADDVAPEALPAPSAPSRELSPPSPEVRRALEIALAGRHHCLLLGPRGSGKSQALQWAVARLPLPSIEDELRTELLCEARGEPRSRRAILACPEPSVRPAALLGHIGPNETRPGLFAVAHRGVLLADELPEWPRDSRECLRGPLEERVVRLTRARARVEFAADFRLLASGNLCACGGLPPALGAELPEGDALRCRCTPLQREQYLARLSGPILDRLDLVLRICSRPRLGSDPGEDDASERLARATGALMAAYGALPSSLAPERLEEVLASLPAWREWESGVAWPTLRARHRVASVALTIAVLEGAEPRARHFAEARVYRSERL